MKVWLAAVALMFYARVVLLKVTMLEPGVNTPPLLVQSPSKLIVVIVPAERVPPVNVIDPLRAKVVVLPAPVNELVLLRTMLLNVCVAAEPFKFPAVALSKVTVPEPAENAPPLLVQLPAAVMFAPAVKVPAVKTALPLMSSEDGAVNKPSIIVRLLTTSAVVFAAADNVPPALLTAKLLKVWVTGVPLIL